MKSFYYRSLLSTEAGSSRSDVLAMQITLIERSNAFDLCIQILVNFGSGAGQ